MWLYISRGFFYSDTIFSVSSPLEQIWILKFARQPLFPTETRAFSALEYCPSMLRVTFVIYNYAQSSLFPLDHNSELLVKNACEHDKN